MQAPARGRRNSGFSIQPDRPSALKIGTGSSTVQWPPVIETMPGGSTLEVFQSAGANLLARGDGSDIAGTGLLNRRSPRYRAVTAKACTRDLRYGVIIQDWTKEIEAAAAVRTIGRTRAARMYVRRWPNVSPTDPPKRIRPARVSRYAFATHCDASNPTPSSDFTFGKCDVDDGAVDEPEAGPEYGGGQHPAWVASSGANR